MALAASPTPEDACLFLREEHGINAKPEYLATIVRMKPKQYEELRERIAPFKEKILTHNLMDNALYASEVTRVGMEQLMQKLEAGHIKPEYLSRVARDVADVQAKSIDKKLALEGRPTTIVENRSPQEIIRQLERKGVLKQIEVESG